MSTSASGDQPTRTTPIGNTIELLVDRPVAGGQCMGRRDGQVVFVRGALPGETVRVRVVGHGKRGAFLRAEVVEVLAAAPMRVVPPCPVAGECGGCDLQHASVSGQRELKAAVIVDALRRTGGVDRIGGIDLADAVTVQAAGDGDGLNWRTRMRFATDDDGTLGLRAHNSHRVVPAAACPIATPGIRAAIGRATSWPADAQVVAAESSTGEVYVSGVVTPDAFTEQVRDRTWHIPATVFWQVHPNAASLLVDTVLAMAEPQPGESVLDLYSGSGLFAAFLGEAVGVTGRVDAVEGSPAAVKAARHNLADLDQVHHHRSDVIAWLRHSKRRPVDLVVLDPPRSGAARDVIRAIAARQPSRIVYVACDPVALARDVKTLAELGYTLTSLAAFDIFPMTKHVECVALIERAAQRS